MNKKTQQILLIVGHVQECSHITKQVKKLNNETTMQYDPEEYKKWKEECQEIHNLYQLSYETSPPPPYNPQSMLR